MKKWQVSTSEHVAAAGTDSNKSKWLILEQKFQCRQLQGSMQRTVKIMSVMWIILDQFLCLCLLVIWMMRRKLDFYLHWCFTNTSSFFRFYFICLNFLSRMTLLFQNSILFLLIISDWYRLDNRHWINIKYKIFLHSNS